MKSGQKRRYRVSKSVDSLPTEGNFINLRGLVRRSAANLLPDLPKKAPLRPTEWQTRSVVYKWQCLVDEEDEKRLNLLAVACGVSRYQLVRACLFALLDEAEKGGIFDAVDLGPGS